MRAATDRGVTRANAGAAAAAAAAVIAVAVAGVGCSDGPLDVGDAVPGTLQMGLVAHWTFDDGTGTAVRDSAGRGLHGVVSGPTWIEGHFGGALHFSGQGDVSVPSFPQATASWSVSLWTRLPADQVNTDYVTLVSNEIVFNGGWELNALLTADGRTYQFAYPLDAAARTYDFYDCACVEPDRWTHLVAVVDARRGAVFFYRDGVLHGSVPMTKTIAPGSTTLHFGRWEGEGRFLTGDIDDVAVYERALAHHEVAALTTSPAPR
jgi:hypothetical protein